MKKDNVTVSMQLPKKALMSRLFSIRSSHHRSLYAKDNTNAFANNGKAWKSIMQKRWGKKKKRSGVQNPKATSQKVRS